MLIAKLSVGIKDIGIHFNSAAELGTDKGRGTVLPSGQVVRGLGTHFKDKESKERYETLVREANDIRNRFNRQFMRTPIEGTFVIPMPGQAKFFVDSQPHSGDLQVSVVEFELRATGGSMTAMEMSDWGQRVKNQLLAVPLGRGETLNMTGVVAIETLAACPVMASETRDRILSLTRQLRDGLITRKDFKRLLEMLQVKMDPAALN